MLPGITGIHSPLFCKQARSVVGTLNFFACAAAPTCWARHDASTATASMTPNLMRTFIVVSNARGKRPRNAVRLTELLGGGARTLAVPVNEATMPAL